MVLNEQMVPVPASAEAAAILAEGLRQLGLDRLPWTKALAQWRDRVLFLRRAEGEEWPDLSDASLSKDVNWLVPFLEGKTALSQFSADEFAAALQALLPYPLTRRLDQEAPTHFTAPTGSAVPIEYTEEGPKLSIRVQELFGLDRHPAIAKGKTSADDRTALASASTGAGDARSAEFLARQLCRGESRDARALSSPSLAGRSGAGRADAARQAAWDLGDPHGPRAAFICEGPVGPGPTYPMRLFRLIHRSLFVRKAAYPNDRVRTALGTAWFNFPEIVQFG